MQREPCRSKAIASAGYDEASGVLTLEFRSGHVYRYEGVPAGIYAWLLRTRNKGGFVRRMIIGRYPEQPAASAGPPLSGAGGSLEDALRASLERLQKPLA